MSEVVLAMLIVLVSACAARAGGTLDLIDGDWSAPAKLAADESGSRTIQWDYAFADPVRGEDLSISHPLPADMTSFGGFVVRVYLDSPHDTVFKVRFYEKDGDNWEWAWGPGKAAPGWNVFRIADFPRGGSGPWSWDTGDHRRDYLSMDRVTLRLTDEPHRQKCESGRLLVSDFHFLSHAEAEQLAVELANTTRAELDRMVDLKQVCAMESADRWAGPRPEDMSVSDDHVEGAGSLQVNLNIHPGEHLRFERNLVRGNDRVEKDFSAVRTIGFQWKSDAAKWGAAVFRLWDRHGGWLEWPLPKPSGDWSKVTLSVPQDAAGMANPKRIGGFMWEFRAGEKAVRDNVKLDNLQFGETEQKGVQPIKHSVPRADSGPGIHAVPVENPYTPPPFHTVVMLTPVSYALQEGNPDQAIERIKKGLARYEGIPGLEFAFGPERNEAITELGEAKFNDTLTKVAEWCEQNRVPFYIQVAGPGGIATPCESAKAVLDAAPTYCRGIWMGETPVEEYRDGVDKLVAMLDLVHSRGKRLCYHRFTNAWWNFALNKSNLERTFAPRFADTFVPLWENLEPSCEGLALGSVLGFWLSGRSREWGVSIQSWWWENMKLGDTNDMPAHNWMRMFVSTIGLGATYMQIEPEWSMTGETLDSLRRFGELLKSGAVVQSAGPEYSVSVPKVVLQMQPTERTENGGMLHQVPWNYIDRSMQRLDDDIFRTLYRAPHPYEELMPQTPNGLIAVVPQGRPAVGKEALLTDGMRVLDKDAWLSPEDSPVRVMSAYREAADDLPLRADGCYFTATRVGKGDYLTYLLDPEERFPTGVKTVLHVRLPKPWTAYDAVTGEELQADGSSVNVAVPAGGYRLVRVIER